MRKYPGVRRVSDGKFEIRLKIINPKNGRTNDIKKIVEAATPAEAVVLREQLRAELAQQGPSTERVRLRAAALSWMRLKVSSLKASTRRTYADALDKKIVPILGDYFLDAITPADIVRWREIQATTPIPKRKQNATDDDADAKETEDATPRMPSPVTVNSRMRVLKHFLADVTYEMGIPDPAARVGCLREPHRTTPKGLTAPDLRAMLIEMKRLYPEWYPITLTLALTGARWGEVSALKWEHIDETRKVIVIAQAHVRGHLDTTKTDSVREVPLAPELATTLKEHRRRLLEDQALGIAEGWVFPSRSGSLMQPSSLRDPLAAACKKAEVRVISPHGLRYTFNHLARIVAAGEVVRAMTGHVTTEMTTHYDWVEQKEKERAMAKVVQLALPKGRKSGRSGGRSRVRAVGAT